jgi:hypothetical protein
MFGDYKERRCAYLKVSLLEDVIHDIVGPDEMTNGDDR